MYVYLAEGQRKPDDPEFGEGFLLLFVVLWHLLVLVALVCIVLPVRLILEYRRRRRTRSRTTPRDPEKDVWRYGY